MLLRLSTLLMITAFFTQTFSSSCIVVDYFMNTSSYSKKCINKNKPQMHCNGKCQVMKKITEKEKTEQESQQKTENKIIFYESYFPSLNTFFTSSAIHFTTNRSPLSVGNETDLLRPPQSGFTIMIRV